ncbi:MAG TPA: CoA pyrophosphatase [Burkholderiales bacterium]|jgi:8-oxo-dGTP pyrophosphatase MutT (NUDIX family)|nr:CoA pyrophosphatase [Burkholderiales bacterium]
MRSGELKAFSEQWLRDRFASTLDYEPVTQGDGHLWCREEEIRSAAVLVPVVCETDGSLELLFTKRAAHLHDHASQISFPGGRVEPEDSGIRATALRETAEEIGLHPERVQVLGELNPYTTVTGYRVVPVVALIHAPIALELDAFEVAEVFRMPLQHLLDPANHVRHSVSYNGRQRYYFALPYGPHYIWGATAGMLMNFYRFLMR